MYRTESLYKGIFELSRSRNIQIMKRTESLLKIAGMKLEFSNLKIRFHKHQVRSLSSKTAKGRP